MTVAASSNPHGSDVNSHCKNQAVLASNASQGRMLATAAVAGVDMPHLQPRPDWVLDVLSVQEAECTARLQGIQLIRKALQDSSNNQVG